jgi:hypothetical protein
LTHSHHAGVGPRRHSANFTSNAESHRCGIGVGWVVSPQHGKRRQDHGLACFLASAPRTRRMRARSSGWKKNIYSALAGLQGSAVRFPFRNKITRCPMPHEARGIGCSLMVADARNLRREIDKSQLIVLGQIVKYGANRDVEDTVVVVAETMAFQSEIP